MPFQWIAGSEYEQDVVFDSTGENIVASRFLVMAHNISDSQEDMRMMLDLRRICDESVFKCTVFHPLFKLFDQVSFF